MKRRETMRVVYRESRNRWEATVEVSYPDDPDYNDEHYDEIDFSIYLNDALDLFCYSDGIDQRWVDWAASMAGREPMIETKEFEE